jgi:hypothetical protein
MIAAHSSGVVPAAEGLSTVGQGSYESHGPPMLG